MEHLLDLVSGGSDFSEYDNNSNNTRQNRVNDVSNMIDSGVPGLNAGKEASIEAISDTFTPSQLREFASDNNARFIADLEFVTLLSNPDYLEYLATSPEGYFEKPEFIRYLHYLGYMFKIGTNFPLPNPSVLAFLQLVQSPTFRKHLKYTKTMNEIREAQHFHWSSSRETTYRQDTVNYVMKKSQELATAVYPLEALMAKYAKLDAQADVDSIALEAVEEFTHQVQKAKADNGDPGVEPLGKKPKLEHM